MKKVLTLALALVASAAFIGLGAAPAFAIKRCWCKAIKNVGDTAGTKISDPLIDFGSLATYKGWNVGQWNNDCRDKCSKAASTNASFNNKTWLCQQLKVKGHHRVSAYSAVDSAGIYRVAQSIEFDCTGGDTICKCPTGWKCNGCSPQVDGGITSDGKCKKLACQNNVIAPLPGNGTQVGNPAWGFTWGNAFIAWGTAANGGAPNCVTTPWESHSGKRGPLGRLRDQLKSATSH